MLTVALRREGRAPIRSIRNTMIKKSRKVTMVAPVLRTIMGPLVPIRAERNPVTKRAWTKTKNLETLVLLVLQDQMERLVLQGRVAWLVLQDRLAWLVLQG